MIVPAGRITRLFGTDGGVMLSLYPAFPEHFDREMPLLVSIDGLDVPIYCDRFERRGRTGATATFADFDSDSRALMLIGLEFRIEQHEEGDGDDEFYLEDLIGFRVEGSETRLDSEPKHFEGMLTDFYDSEANPLFELETDGRRVLIPAVEEFIAHIDFERKRMVLLLPEGLLDLG